MDNSLALCLTKVAAPARSLPQVPLCAADLVPLIIKFSLVC